MQIGIEIAKARTATGSWSMTRESFEGHWSASCGSVRLKNCQCSPACQAFAAPTGTSINFAVQPRESRPDRSFRGCSNKAAARSERPAGHRHAREQWCAERLDHGESG